MLINFVEDGFVSHAGQPRLDDQEYARTLDNVVVACVDCGVVCDGQLLLGYRTQEPYKNGWWVMGGRMMPGEAFEVTAQNVLRRELGLEIPEQERFKYLFTGNFIWHTRAQEPIEHGCHMIGVTLWVLITSEEKACIQHKQDFAKLVWADLSSIRANESYHPATRLVATKIQHG